MKYDFDVAIIGSGPGGYVAAIRAAQLKLRVVVIEKGDLGGVCLNIGCIPTKAIIHQAETFRNRAKLAAMGVAVDDSGFKYENVFNASRKTADTLSKGVAYLLKKNGVEVVKGVGKLASEHEIEVDGSRKISARAIILATGSRPKTIPGLEFDGERVLSSDDALMMKDLPRRALIVGAGAIGAEFAHILNAFGSEVHLVEMAESILPLEDKEVSSTLSRSFAKRGIKIYAPSKIISHQINGGSITAIIERRGDNPSIESTEIIVDKIFVMTGRTPNTENVGLETVGVKARPNGFVEVDDYYRTNVLSIYAIGDTATGAPLLAHVASREGEIAVEHIADQSPAPIDNMKIPSVIYCEPQIASFGHTEESAVAKNIPYEKSVFPFRACGKAVAAGEHDGFVKILTSSKKIIGAHIIGHGASELIHELLIAEDITQISSTIHAHPTLSETIMEVARGKEAIHI